MKHHVRERILMKNMRIGIIDKIIEDDKYLVSYYENNKLRYSIIDDFSIIEEEEYEKIKNRNNIINKLFS